MYGAGGNRPTAMARFSVHHRGPLFLTGFAGELAITEGIDAQGEVWVKIDAFRARAQCWSAMTSREHQ